MRNSWKSGDYLMVDDESGLTHYASDMVRDWNGQWRHKDNLDGRHPQLDVKAKRDPQALRDVRDKPTSDTGGDFIVQEDGLFKFILEDSSAAANAFFIIAETVTVR